MSSLTSFLTAIEDGKLANELIEATVRREQVSQCHGQHGRSSDRPRKQDEVSEIATVDDGINELLEYVNDLFLAIWILVRGW